MKNQRGITLIALILIMVGLVILAGISISLVVSDNAEKSNSNGGNDDISTTYDSSYETENLLDVEPTANVSDVVNGSTVNNLENVEETNSSVVNNVENEVANTVSNEVE